MMDPDMSILERMVPTEDGHLANLGSKLGNSFALDAAEKLGYDTLKSKNSDAYLRQGLQYLDVLPYTVESVGKYQTQVGGEVRPSFLDRLLVVVDYTLLFVAVFCFGPAILGWFVSITVGATFLIGLALSIICFGLLSGRKQKDPGKWQMIALATYDGYVPSRVLALALKIKEEMPSVGFAIEQYICKGEVLHSLLLVCRDGRAHYIDVWDDDEEDAIEDEEETSEV